MHLLQNMLQKKLPAGGRKKKFARFSSHIRYRNGEPDQMEKA